MLQTATLQTRGPRLVNLCSLATLHEAVNTWSCSVIFWETAARSRHGFGGPGM
jgi:hypothetical protein